MTSQGLKRWKVIPYVVLLLAVAVAVTIVWMFFHPVIHLGGAGNLRTSRPDILLTSTYLNLPMPSKIRADLDRYHEETATKISEFYSRYPQEQNISYDIQKNKTEQNITIFFSGYGIKADGSKETVNEVLLFDFYY